MVAVFSSAQLVVSAEHASRHVPRELHGLGLERCWLLGHHAWDPGVATVSTELARRFGAPLHLGDISRLVCDLNRSRRHPHVVARRLRPEGLPIPANVDLDTRGRRARLERFWWPWREAVERDLDAVGRPLHLSIHSFTDQLTPAHPPRGNDFALMYWPDRPGERALADRLHTRLAARGHSVRRNWPYSGREDGYCMRLRHQRPDRRYVAMEIEINQLLCGTLAGARRMADLLAEVLAPEFGR